MHIIKHWLVKRILKNAGGLKISHYFQAWVRWEKMPTRAETQTLQEWVHPCLTGWQGGRAAAGRICRNLFSDSLPSTGGAELTAEASRGCRGGCHREESHWWPSPCLLGYYGKSFTGWWYTGGTRLQSPERVTREVAGSGEAYSCIRRVWSWRRHERSWVLGKPCCRCLALEEQPCRRLEREAPT